MIDVAKLTPLQAVIFLLIERHGDAGRRVCELCQEVKADKRSVVRVLAHLFESGLIVKVGSDTMLPQIFLSFRPANFQQGLFQWFVRKCL